MQRMERFYHDSPPPTELDAEHMQSLLSQPNRRARRIDLGREVQLQIADCEGFVAGCVQNISATGMFVRCPAPRPPGTVVGFELSLTEGSPLIRGRAEVIWTRHRDAGPEQPGGMGLHFLGLDRESRQMIQWLVDQRSRELRQILRPNDSGPALDPAIGSSDLVELANEVERALAAVDLEKLCAEVVPASAEPRKPVDTEALFAEMERALTELEDPTGAEEPFIEDDSTAVREADSLEELLAEVENTLDSILPSPPSAAPPAPPEPQKRATRPASEAFRVSPGAGYGYPPRSPGRRRTPWTAVRALFAGLLSNLGDRRRTLEERSTAP